MSSTNQTVNTTTTSSNKGPSTLDIVGMIIIIIICYFIIIYGLSIFTGMSIWEIQMYIMAFSFLS
jgi:uncharacterized protein (DUF983 family)